MLSRQFMEVRLWTGLRDDGETRACFPGNHSPGKWGLRLGLEVTAEELINCRGRGSINE